MLLKRNGHGEERIVAAVKYLEIQGGFWPKSNVLWIAFILTQASPLEPTESRRHCGFMFLEWSVTASLNSLLKGDFQEPVESQPSPSFPTLCGYGALSRGICQDFDRWVS